MVVIYLHGFASSPQSSKATFFAERFARGGNQVSLPRSQPARVSDAHRLADASAARKTDLIAAAWRDRVDRLEPRRIRGGRGRRAPGWRGATPDRASHPARARGRARVGSLVGGRARRRRRAGGKPATSKSSTMRRTGPSGSSLASMRMRRDITRHRGACRYRC